MNPIDIALRIATSAHAGQLDRDGYPVILHPLTVGLMGHTDEEKMAAFLHDVVEDTSYSFEDLLHEGIPTGVVNALSILTHQPGTDYFDYVQSIIDSQNPIALQVKYNDLQHNFQRGKAYPDLQKKHGKAQTDGVGPDLRPQYRSCIFYRNESQKQTAEHVTELLRSKGDEVNTLLLPEETFYIGEAYHQHYYEKTDGEPYCHLRTKKF